MTSAFPCNIVWFREDLRVDDNPALYRACAGALPVIGVYVLDERAGARPLGGAARWFVHGALTDLERSLGRLGIPLLLRRGETVAALTDIIATGKIAALFHGKVVDHVAARLEGEVARAMTQHGVAVHAVNAGLLHEPRELRTGNRENFRVFTPFWRAALAKGAPRAPLPAPAQRAAALPAQPSEKLEDWYLRPTTPNWALNFPSDPAGETGAREQLATFLDHGLAGYARGRDFPALPSTSRLSAALRFGALSPYRLWHALEGTRERDGSLAGDIDKFQAELGWREFSHHLLAAFPLLHERNFQARFDAFPWRDDPDALRAWQRGETGIPIVDAGMRQLWQSGYMHNRVRMIVASFLTKHLLIDWRAGEAWFWDTLIDACPANNPAGWQWVAGCGADAAPYFRVFNPVLQGEKFDPDGAYVRRFVPELGALPNRLIHRPFEAGGLELAAAGIKLGSHYPCPLIDLHQGRARALAAFESVKAHE